MALRTAHGKGSAALVRVETLPANELPIGVQAEALAPAGDERRPDGRFAPGARTVQRAGGKATAGKTRLAGKLGLSDLPEGADFAPYRRAATTFRRVQCADLARTVGGGVCGPGPSSIVASAALALAWSRYLSDLSAKTGDHELAIKAIRLGDASRQSLLTAHELCAKEALARSHQTQGVDLDAVMRQAAAETEARREEERRARRRAPDPEPYASDAPRTRVAETP